MIDDSYAWKDRLRRSRALVRRKLGEAKGNRDRADAAFVEVEAFVFLTGFIIRKLIEAKKMSDELESAVMTVVAFPAKPAFPLDFWNADKIDRGYDLMAGGSKTIGLRDLCNLLVHSFVFMPTSDDTRCEWTGFLLNSDHTKDKELIFIASDDFDQLVDEVLGDYVVTMHVDRIQKRVTKSRTMEGNEPAAISLNAH